MKSESAKEILENAIAELYRAFYRMREAKEYQEEYDSMGVIINMLTQDRIHLRQHYDIEI